MWDNGDNTYSESERRAVDLSEKPQNVAAGVKSRWPTTRQGIPFVLPGHPDTQTKHLQITDADGAQTNFNMIDAFEGTSIVVTKVSVNQYRTVSGFNVKCYHIYMRLSVVIPSFKDPLLIKTIDSLLANSELGDNMEVISVLDGFWPSFQLIEDKRVRYVHLGRNRGMRGAINAGVDVARGRFIMRTDQHCMFAKGYDRILTDTCQSNWIVTARRYFLDPIKWEVMDIPYIDYEKLVIQGGVKFSGQRWDSRTQERKDIMIDETMAMQGSMWLMSIDWWHKVIGELQTEGYGQMYQDSHEMIFKTWKAGGKMMVNKNTWFAHKHRSFVEGRHEGTEENSSLRHESGLYALSVWKDYYDREIRPKWGL